MVFVGEGGLGGRAKAEAVAGGQHAALAILGDDEFAALDPDRLADPRIGRGRQINAFPGGHFDLDDFDGMVGPAEHLSARIARGGIAPHRLVGGARQQRLRAFAFGAHQQARQRQVEGAGEPHQDHRGGAQLLAFDLADGRLGDPGSFGQLRQRPAAGVPLQPQPARDPGSGIVSYNRHMSLIVD